MGSKETDAQDIDVRGIDVVSWDVDGTLYDLSRMVRVLFWLGFKGIFAPGPIRTYRELRRLSRFRTAMAEVRADGGAIADSLPADRAELIAIESRWYGRAIARIGPRPGIAHLLDSFAAQGKRQIVVSDYNAGYKLDLLGLDARFERVYAGEDIGFLKPSPILFERVCADLAIAPERLLHIGDRDDRDGASAEAAGCRSLIIGHALPRGRQ